jgi:hypothetical protein
MVQPRNPFSALLSFRIYRGRSPLLAGAALALCLSCFASRGAGTPPADPPPADPPGAAALEEAAKVPAVEGSSLPPNAPTEAAAARGLVEAKPPQPSGDERRRLLMFLLMNRAGPVRPFGGPGH